jgi:peptidoglycan-N-acetylglucosamine deacetylase
VLCRLGLRLVSWTRRGFDTVTADPQKVLARLIRRLRAGDILLLHDGHAARTATGQAVILEVLPPLLAALQRAGLSSTSLRGAL